MSKYAFLCVYAFVGLWYLVKTFSYFLGGKKMNAYARNITGEKQTLLSEINGNKLCTLDTSAVEMEMTSRKMP